MTGLLYAWERCILAGLMFSLALLGVGRVEFFSTGVSMSAWSVSRTTFFFWLTLKLALLLRGGWAGTGLSDLGSLKPLYLFFFTVTLSLLPDFRQAGDYRYFFFGCAHAVMLVDVFSGAAQKRWLPLLLGVLPVVLVVRGLLHDPAVLNLSLAYRFGYPLDHPNTAGYLLSMSLPLAIFVTAAYSGPWWRGLGAFSCLSQMFALVLTFSRGAWLGAAAAVLYLAIASGKWKHLVAATAVVFVGILGAPSIQDRLVSVARPSEDLALQERWQRMTSSLQLGMDHPIVGVGYGRGRLKAALPAYFKGTLLEGGPVLHTHNVYVELFAETGLLGLIAFLWLLGDTFMRLWRSARKRAGPARHLGFALTASWIALMIGGLGDVPFFHHETRVFFFTLLALACLYASADDRSDRYWF